MPATREADVLSSTSVPVRIDSSVFRDGQKARSNDIFIAVMGLTGSGKSTFLSHLTKSQVEIGDNLRSCTKEVSVYQYKYNNATNVYLVDTPGFDDTNLSDTDVLREIATWLTGSYNNKVKLTGILYLHRIIDPRMGGSAKKNLFMFKKLCGPEALKHVVLVTTMWEQVDEKVGLSRERELEETEDFWGYMLGKGSRIERHMNTPESARRIVEIFMSKGRPSSPVLLAIQDEMVNNNKDLDETEAGRGLDDVLAREREKFRRELEQTRQEMQEAIDLRDKESQEELSKQQAESEKRMKQLQVQQMELKTTMEKLHREKYEALEADMTKHRKQQEEEWKKRTEVWNKEREELNGKYVNLGATLKKTMEQNGHSIVATGQPAAWGRTISLTLRGTNYAFVGPHSNTGNLTKEMRIDKDRPVDGNCLRLKRLILGDTDDAYFAHQHTGIFVTSCHYNGRVKDSYPGLYDFLNGKNGTACPKSISLGPQGSYFISTGKKSSFKCHPNAAIDHEAALATQLWWGFDGAYVMAQKGQPLKVNLRGHYPALAELLESKPYCKIQELAMDIKGPNAYAVIFKDRTVSFNDEDNVWGRAFQEYTTLNFGLSWKT